MRGGLRTRRILAEGRDDHTKFFTLTSITPIMRYAMPHFAGLPTDISCIELTRARRSQITKPQGSAIFEGIALRKFWKDEDGATAIEYGLIAALVSVVIISVLGTLGSQLNTTFSRVVSGLGGA